MATIMAGQYRFKDTITIPTFTNIIALPTQITGILTAENVENLNAQFKGTGNISYQVPVDEYIITASYTEWQIIHGTVAKVNLLNGAFNSSPYNEVMCTKVLPDVLYKGEGIYTSEGARPSKYMQTFQVLADTTTIDEFGTWFAESTELVPAEEGGVTIPIAERIKNTLNRLIADTNEKTEVGHSTLQAGVNTLLEGYGEGEFKQEQADWDQTDIHAVNYIKNKPEIPEPQERADWNQTDPNAVSYILNKPEIPKQKQVDWNQTDSTAVDYILNKPEIPEQEQVDWEETDQNSVKYIDNKPTILTENDVITLIGQYGGGGSGGVVTEETVILATDLYAYTPIGALTDASKSNPKIVARKGDTLKAVFNAIFGIKQEIQPTITSNIGLTVTQDSTVTSVGTTNVTEVGTAYPSEVTELTFTLNNSGSANYGVRCGNTKYTGNQQFYYAIETQNNAQLKITFPSSDLAEAATIVPGAGTEISRNDKSLYCDFNNNKQVTIQIELPSASVSTEKQTRYDLITANVEFGHAQTINGTPIDAFLTSFENDATNTATLSGGSKSVTTKAYTVNAGRYYIYSRVGGEYEGEGPITGCTQQSAEDGDNENGYAYTAGDYVWLYHISDNQTLQTEFLGIWGDVDNQKHYSDPVEITLQNGVTASYYVYRTGKMVREGSARYRLIQQGDK